MSKDKDILIVTQDNKIITDSSTELFVVDRVNHVLQSKYLGATNGVSRYKQTYKLSEIANHKRSDFLYFVSETDAHEFILMHKCHLSINHILHTIDRIDKVGLNREYIRITDLIAEIRTIS